ncbi:MAG: hypothetical protein ACRDV9_06970 [Acidimicrobiia bacterium]
MRIVGCISDLMFATRLRDTARQLGHECKIVGSPATLSEHLPGVDLVLVDLGNRLGGGLGAVETAVAAGVTVVAYGEHVLPEELEKARSAGADSVLTRGELARRLPKLLGSEGGEISQDPSKAD